MKRILIATDGSPAAAEAVAFGVNLAARQGAGVTFVHVLPAAFAAAPGGFAGTRRLPPLLVRDDEAALSTAAELARETGVDADVVLVSGNSADEIVTYADTIDADMIVVGSRGRNAVTSALLGSVSRDVLHEARRPVLVVPRTTQRRELVPSRHANTRSEA